MRASVPVPLIGDHVYLAARATVARRLIREGKVDPYVALSYVVFPTEALLEAEHACSRGTLVGRAFSTRQNR